MIQKKVVIDLEFKIYYNHSLFHNIQKGMANEYRKNCFLTSNRFHTHAWISQMCSTLRRQLQSKKLFMLWSISLYDICPINNRESLRDIEACLRSMQEKLYHMWIRGNVSCSTLADANETRNWRIYVDSAQVLIHRARDLYSNDEFCIELDQTVYALDSTTIDLCLSLFPWAKFRKHKGVLMCKTLRNEKTLDNSSVNW